MATSDPLDAVFATAGAAPQGAQTTSAPTADPLDAVFSAKPETTPQAAPAAAGLPAVDPLDSVFKTTNTPTSMTQATSNPSEDPLNFLDANKKYEDGQKRGLSQEELDYGQTDPEKMEDAPWYAKAWEWMNSPLWDFHKLGTREGAGTFERGLETGMEDLVNGFFTPLQVGLFLGTLGGSAVEDVGLSALRGLGVGAARAETVAKTAKALMSTGFTIDMMKGLMTQAPQFLDALKDGDYEAATRLGTDLLGGGALAIHGLRHGIEDIKTIKDFASGKLLTTTETLKLAKELDGTRAESIKKGEDGARAKMEEMRRLYDEAGLNTPTLEAGARHFRTQGGDLGRIRNMIGILEGNQTPNEYTGQEMVYAAVDSTVADQVRNSGLKSPEREKFQYYPTAQEAIDNATLPGDKTGPTHYYDATTKKILPVEAKPPLSVFSVPRAEVERGVLEDLAKRAGKEGGPQQVPSGRVPDEDLIATRTHMPSHELEVDDQGNLTGNKKALRPMGAEDLPADISRYLQANDPKERQSIIDGLKAALTLTADQQDAVKALGKLYDESFQKMFENGLIHSWVESYHPQAWADREESVWNKILGRGMEDVDSKTLNALRHDADNGRFSTNVNQARHRVYQTEFQGLLAGEHFKSDDMTTHLYNHLRAVEHAVANREYIDSLRSKSVPGPDGRPAIVMEGTTRKVGDDENPAIAINTKSTKPIHIDPEKVQIMREGINPRTGRTDLDEGLRTGRIIELPWDVEGVDDNGNPRKERGYAYSTEGYVAIDHAAMRNWFYSGEDTAKNPALMYGNMLVHPDLVTEVRRVLGAEKSIVRGSKILSGLNTASGEAKGLLLSMSPFHVVQEGLRALMVGINPFKVDHIDSNSNPTLARLYKNGLLTNDFKAKDEYSTGYASHSRLIDALPGVRNIQTKLQTFLFDKYIPSLKERASIKIFNDLMEKYPHLTEDQAASRAADMTNDVFGGQNWRKLGWSTSAQDFSRMFLLAPDWLVSEMRMLSRAAGVMDKETGALTRKMMLVQLGTFWTAARVLNLLISGNAHNEAPFGVATKDDKGEEKVYSMRSLPTDLLHVMTDPRGFIQNRVNPLVVRTAIEGITGRDALGRRVTPEDEVKDAFRNFMPITAQGLVPGLQTVSGGSPVDQLMKGAGVTVRKYNTEAEKLAKQFASDRMPSGPVDPERLKAHQEDIRLEGALQRGEIGKAQILQSVGKRRADEIIRRKNMNPLQSAFDRLPLREAIDVWQAATPAEKDALTLMLWKKRVSYLKQHNAAERANDPTWLKLQRVYGDLRK